MNKTLIIKRDENISHACEIIRGLDLSQVWEVTIRPRKKGRSIAANNLYWVWVTELANYMGHHKNEMHYIFKEQFLVSIYRASDEGYRTMIETVMKLQGDDSYPAMKKQIIKLTSTTKANVSQFVEYLQQIEIHAAKIGCPLSHPEDSYYEAMGIKEK